MNFTDQLGNNVQLSQFPPNRIVSLVPSQTELLCHLGLGSRLVGVTRFCIHPSQIRRQATIVGGTKDYSPERIATLNPDLIIANQEENTEATIAQLSRQFPVWVSRISTLSEALHMIAMAGQMTDTSAKATQCCQQIITAWKNILPLQPSASAAYLIWRNPYMVAGGDTFISEILRICGINNVFLHEKRYPTTNCEELRRLQPDLVLLSSEPYPFKPEQAAELQAQLPHTKVQIVDGEMFSWYGSRLLQSAQYCQHWLDELRRYL